MKNATARSRRSPTEFWLAAVYRGQRCSELQPLLWKRRIEKAHEGLDLRARQSDRDMERPEFGRPARGWSPVDQPTGRQVLGHQYPGQLGHKLRVTAARDTLRQAARLMRSSAAYQAGFETANVTEDSAAIRAGSSGPDRCNLIASTTPAPPLCGRGEMLLALLAGHPGLRVR